MAGPSKLVKSIFWLTSFTGLGYALLIFTTPSQAEIEQIKKELPGFEKNPKERISKNQQFLNVLETASKSNTPIYRLNKEELEKEIKK